KQDAKQTLTRQRVGRDRQNAQRALTQVNAAIDTGDYAPPKTIVFREWADRWLASLQRERSTVRSYVSTIGYAKRAFGDVSVRHLTTEDLHRLLGIMAKEELSAGTQRKHLRVLGGCIQSAVVAGYAAKNPVRLLPNAEKPRPHKRESAYFTDAELSAIAAVMDDDDPYKPLFKMALLTGARLGELSAATWGDVDMLDKILHIRWSYTDGVVKRPKSHERRDIEINGDVVALLGEQYRRHSNPDDDKLVFPGATKSGYLSADMPRRTLYAAMERAGVDRVGPTGEKRTFHSFRHSFARTVLEAGQPIFWLSRHLGHSSVSVTENAYGHWSRDAHRRVADELEGVFAV
ncbi:MAG: site-specific integrase, partial [Patescibacteria group bacterium]|nr:site-specific integrase [Patescibacteria group bacterium]